MYWNWINVFDHDRFVGSFYTESTKKEDITKEINLKYGERKWTKFTSE